MQFMKPSVDESNRDSAYIDPKMGLGIEKLLKDVESNLSENESVSVPRDTEKQYKRGGGIRSDSASKSVGSSSNSRLSFRDWDTNAEITRLNKNIFNSRLKRSYTWDPAMASEIVHDIVSGLGSNDMGSKLVPTVLDDSVCSKKKIAGFDSISLWGFTSIQGRLPEMEDAVMALPRFSNVPSHMFTSASNTNNNTLNHKTPIDFFGVYDGHGGCQVSNYCQSRLHLALAEEIDIAKPDDENMAYNRRNWWEQVFLSCFRRVDTEVGGGPSSSSSELIAPESVGSTAVVAIVCSSHIIVANCGDSRAVLCRGKEATALSIDHKPDREDEYARIEAAGGKVINWGGYRVSGVLAMSRAIGDVYLRPYVIPDPEVTFVTRSKTDDCLILASDGLWDVLRNEEVCDIARRRIILWHKKNGESVSAAERSRGADGGMDPAAQDAAEYLSRLALRKGSKDNISVLVVDLKQQRKFKKRTI